MFETKTDNQVGDKKYHKPLNVIQIIVTINSGVFRILSRGIYVGILANI